MENIEWIGHISWKGGLARVLGSVGRRGASNYFPVYLVADRGQIFFNELEMGVISLARRGKEGLSWDVTAKVRKREDDGSFVKIRSILTVENSVHFKPIKIIKKVISGKAKQTKKGH